MNRLSVFASAAAIGSGFISGVVLNFNREGHIVWYSPSNLVTFAIFVWLLAACGMELSSAGSLGGRRSAYLVIANFVLLLIVLGFVLFSAHAQPLAPQSWLRWHAPAWYAAAEVIG